MELTSVVLRGGAVDMIVGGLTGGVWAAFVYEGVPRRTSLNSRISVYNAAFWVFRCS
jgi:hypothetical protein